VAAELVAEKPDRVWPERVVFVVESGAKPDRTRYHGRYARGVQVRTSSKHGLRVKLKDRALCKYEISLESWPRTDGYSEVALSVCEIVVPWWIRSMTQPFIHTMMAVRAVRWGGEVVVFLVFALQRGHAAFG
jgi:hypothetical protein